MLTRDDAPYTPCAGSGGRTTSSKRRSVALLPFALYSPPNDTGDLMGMCLLYVGHGETTALFMAEGSSSIAIKNFEITSNSSVPPFRALLHARAALHICRIPRGGTKAKQVVDARITHFLTTDACPHHLRFLKMLLMIRSAHSLTSDSSIEEVIAALVSYYTPLQNTILHHLVELYHCVLTSLRKRTTELKASFHGFPYLHIVADLWTEKHTDTACRSILLHFVHPETT